MSRQPKIEPTTEQLLRLRQFAAEHGRNWKTKLNDMWMNGRDANEQDGHLLRQVRNRLGPSWLDKFSLAKAKTVIEQQAAALQAEHDKQGAGFYGRGELAGRYFAARAEIVDGKQRLQVSPDHGQTWITAPEEAHFASYWNTNIELPKD